MFEVSISSLPSFLASMNSWFTPTVLFLLLNLMIGTIFITSGLSTRKQRHEQHPKEQHDEPGRDHPQLVRSPSMLQRLKSINFYSYRSQETTTAFHKSPDRSSENLRAFRLAEQQQEQPQFFRSPSIVQKLKSINIQNFLSLDSSPKHKSQEPDTHFHFPQTLAQEQQQPKEDEQEEEEEEEEEEKQVEDEQIQEQQYRDEEEDKIQNEIYSQLKGGHVSRSNSDTRPTGGKVPTKLSRKMKKSASAKSAFAHFEEQNIALESRRPATVREGKVKTTSEEDDDEVDAKADVFIDKFKHQLKLQRLHSITRYKEMINRGSAK